MSAMGTPASLLIVGCGYVGTRFLGVHGSKGAIGMTRSADSAARLRAIGTDSAWWDLGDPASLPSTDISAVEGILYLAPPPAEGTVDPWLAHFLAECGAAPRRIVYLSTTGVYGDQRGASVDEDTPIHPQSDRARRRADAERQIRQYCERHAIGWTILRVPGIYGPGRLPLDRLRRREPLIRPEEAGLSNRIHVDDLVAALMLVYRSPQAAGRIYNVTDGTSSSMTDYFLTLAELAELPPPPLIGRDSAPDRLTPGLISYLSESRRVLSTRITCELGFEPRYRDLREGIRASLAADEG
jgi:NAD dependent epimerase/dehydratase family enzyme